VFPCRWTISTNFIPDRRLTLFACFLLLLLHVSLFVWQQTLLDPASTLYVWELPPAWGVVGVRCALSAYAAYCLLRTWRLETERARRQFYAVWAALALAWLLSLPVAVSVATALDTWLRRRVVFGVLHSAQAALLCALAYLFRPFRKNRFVAILRPDEARAFGNNNMQVFPMQAEPAVEFTTV